MADAKVFCFEAELSRRLPPLRLGTLEVDGNRIVLKADVMLTPAAARTIAAQLLVLAESISPTRAE